MGRKFIRTIGLARANVKIGLMNLTYNLMPYRQLTNDRTGAPATACEVTNGKPNRLPGNTSYRELSTLISSCGIST